MKITEEMLDEAAQFSNFAQLLKLRIWENSRVAISHPVNGVVRQIPDEETLDKIAQELFDKYIKGI